MKRFATTLLALIVVVMAFAETPDNDRIFATINNVDSPLYYPNLMLRYKEGKPMSEEEYHHLYYGYAFQPTYKPLEVNPSMTRVQEIMEFARKIGAVRIGIANCIGLVNEARLFAKILRANGFEPYSVICKVEGRSKSSMGIPEKCEEIGPAMCNPILQGRLLNQAKTDLNVVIGLCVGHDSLFYRYSEAYVTTLVTKDRVTGHNPAAALYTSNSYYKKGFGL